MNNEECRVLAIRALEAARGDDTARAERAFAAFLPREMQEEHRHSGKTRQQILDEYRAHDRRIDAAIAWVRNA